MQANAANQEPNYLINLHLLIYGSFLLLIEYIIVKHIFGLFWLFQHEFCYIQDAHVFSHSESGNQTFSVAANACSIEFCLFFSLLIKHMIWNISVVYFGFPWLSSVSLSLWIRKPNFLSRCHCLLHWVLVLPEIFLMQILNLMSQKAF